VTAPRGPAPAVPLRDPADLRRLYEAPRDGWHPFTLTDEQLAAATAPLAPGVIVAGAGSGKTTVMQARVVWLAGSGQVRPDQVLGLTFTNKAAGELAQRMRAAFAGAAGEPGDGEPAVSTYHAYAGRLLRDHGLRIGVEPGARLLADATRYQLAGRVLRRAEGPFAELTTSVGHLIGELVALDGELSEHLVDLARLAAEDAALIAEIEALPKPVKFARDALQTARKRGELASLVAALRAEKARLDGLDFGDQLAFAARLALEYPAVGAAERDRYRVVLLDEYQDTSHAQKVLLRSLFGGGHPVTAVGDPCQAIYGWRGASVANIDGFPEEFPDTGGAPARRYPLSVNNRSGGRLLDAANDLSAPLRAVHRGVVPLRPREGRVDDGSITVALHRTSDDELDWVADQVEACLAAGVPAREIAVLTRIRSRFGDYHSAFVRRGIPVEVVGLGGLLHLPEVADIVATLEVLDDPTANAALLRLLTGPRWRIGPRDLVLLGRRAQQLVRPAAGHGGAPRRRAGEDAADLAALLDEAVAGVDPAEVASLSEALADPGGGGYSAEARERFRLLADELAAMRRHVGDPLPDLVGRISAATGLEVEVEARPAGGPGGGGEALAAFLSHAAGFTDLDGEAGLRAFLAYLRAAETYDRGLDSAGPSGADSIKLMTVHKAKGLEWDVVLLPDLTAKVFPSARSRAHWLGSARTLPATLRGDCDDFPPNPAVWNTAGAKEFTAGLGALADLEERRLGYVAATRARRMLFASSHWWGPTQKEPRGPSAYLETLRTHAERAAGRVDRWEPKPAEGESNPALEAAREHAWPVPLAEGPLAARREAAAWVAEALARGETATPTSEVGDGASDGASFDALTVADRERLARWDRDAELLMDEARRSHRVDLDVPLPETLSASAVVRLAKDPDGLARSLVRPMPRPPAPAAALGTRFHAWVEEQFGQQVLLDPIDLEGAADDAFAVHDASLQALQEAFRAGPYAGRMPIAIEAPFQVVLGGHVVRGRIDAVYRDDDGRDEVVDWKTGAGSADVLQLAVYRVAWARLTGVPEGQVGAAFVYVGQDRVERPADLLGSPELERLLTAGGAAPA
jgi:DNA helicase-2/ATP-dependent DNA helicase PcrA